MSEATHRYTVEVEPEAHLAHVTLRLATAGLAAPLALTMPAWCPGSYLVRDYARHVRDLTVCDGDGAPRVPTKVDKSTWHVDPAGAAELVVRYAVYGHELTVRTNHVDASHAFLHGPATFLYAEAGRGQPVEVRVRPPGDRGWRLATGLDGGAFGTAPGEDGAWLLRAPDVDALLDAPIHLGQVEERTFEVAGVPFELAIWGERAAGGAFTVDQLVKDLGAIALDHARRAGGGEPDQPFARYTYLLMLSHEAYGGLEHRASSANLHTPQCLGTRKSYEGLLELLSHELFHAWNGKRIAPAALSSFDYGREAYTRCLWVMEGLTSHYDRWALRTSGVITTRSFAEKVLDDWSRLLAIPGRRRQSLEDSSFDAWIKLYRPDESNLNTTVSYYLKGGLCALALDLEIRRRTEGARSLDDVLRLLWRRHGRTGRPHPEDLEPLFDEATGLGLADFFRRCVRGTDDPELVDELAAHGVALTAGHDPAQTTDGAAAVWLGVTTSGVRVTGVLDGSPAATAGVSPGDELCALDRFRITSDGDARAALAARRPGDRLELALFRRHRLVLLGAEVGAAPPTRYELATVAEPTPAQAARFQAWMGEPLAAGQSLATVTTTSRWL
ncbi:MAG: M61 family metallopeptidase [Kofleriaceae bacterium]|nr:M61 family metallopeptidase [Kofleriaceae bacterium]MCL4227709.1 PDZ domain-containing protein [Myxococcales bacterium]